MYDWMPNLTQSEAEALMAVRKIFEDTSPLMIDRPFREERKLISSANSSDTFYLNINETAIEFGKYFVNNRYFSTPLVRLCMDKDAVHENPDGQKIQGCHIHIYREGYGDKFASELRLANITGTTTIQVIGQFLVFCNIDRIQIQNQGQMI